MRQRTRILVAPLLLAGLAVASCSSDDDSPDEGGGSGGYSIEDLLGHVPADIAAPDSDGDSPLMIVTSDLELAGELAEVDRPTGDAPSEDDVVSWIGPITGFGGSDSGVPTVSALLPNAVGQSFVSSEFADEVGWSIVDVDHFIEYQALPGQFTLIAGDVGEDSLQSAAGEPTDGVYRIGGDDFEVDLDQTSPARPTGGAVRMALHDGLLAVSPSTPPIEAFLADEGDDLGDDEALTDTAAALDDAGVYSAMLTSGGSLDQVRNGTISADQLDRASEWILSEPFDVLGVGLGLDDGTPTATFVYRYADDETATDQVQPVTDMFTNGTSLLTGEPVNEFLDLISVEADGNVVVASVHLAEFLPGNVWQLVQNRDTPTIHR